jgi:hypothetical protein
VTIEFSERIQIQLKRIDSAGSLQPFDEEIALLIQNFELGKNQVTSVSKKFRLGARFENVVIEWFRLNTEPEDWFIIVLYFIIGQCRV